MKISDVYPIRITDEDRKYFYALVLKDDFRKGKAPRGSILYGEDGKYFNIGFPKTDAAQKLAELEKSRKDVCNVASGS